MWSQAIQNTVQLLPMDHYGWIMNGNRLEMIWDTEDNIKKVDDQINYYLKGCGCQKSNCSGVCGCKKKGHHCGPGCACSPQSCKNQPACTSELTSTPTIQNSDESSSSVSDDSGDKGSVYNDKEVLYVEELDKEVDEIMVDIFGELEDCNILLSVWSVIYVPSTCTVCYVYML